jgi:hypothetical protein
LFDDGVECAKWLTDQEHCLIAVQFDRQNDEINERSTFQSVRASSIARR